MSAESDGEIGEELKGLPLLLYRSDSAAEAYDRWNGEAADE